MKQRKAIVAGLAAVLSLGVASGVAWAQDTQGNMKLDNQAQGQAQTQHKKGGADLKAQGSAGSQTQAQSDTTQMKGEAGA